MRNTVWRSLHLALRTMVTETLKEIWKHFIWYVFLFLFGSGGIIYILWRHLSSNITLPAWMPITLILVVIFLLILLIRAIRTGSKAHANSQETKQNETKYLKTVRDTNLGICWNFNNNHGIQWLDIDLSKYGPQMFDTILGAAYHAAPCLGAIGVYHIASTGDAILPTHCHSCNTPIAHKFAQNATPWPISPWQLKRAVLITLQQYHRRHGAFPEVVDLDSVAYRHASS